MICKPYLLIALVSLLAACAHSPDVDPGNNANVMPPLSEKQTVDEPPVAEGEKSEVDAPTLTNDNGMVDVTLNEQTVEMVPESLVPNKSRVQRQIRMQMPTDNSLAAFDPFERVNRVMYNFNARFDEKVFLPVVLGYHYVTPDLVEKGVTNFFSNLGEISNFFNNVLQLKLVDSAVTLTRFVINTTVGVAGLWDPSKEIGLHQKQEDFGQTLGYWGVPAGPYMVLPFIGPSYMRDTGGLVVDFGVDNSLDVLSYVGDQNRDAKQIGINGLHAIDIRKNTAFRYYQTGSPFEYELVRFVVHEIRKVEIEK